LDDLISHLFDAPLPNLLIIAGLIFLGIGVWGKISGKIEPSASGRVMSSIVGLCLVLAGLYIHSTADAAKRSQSQPAAESRSSGEPSSRNPGHDESRTPALAGTWVEIDSPDGKSKPMRLSIRQNGSEITVRLSYTDVFSGVFGQAPLVGSKATWTTPQACGAEFRKPGYNYDDPGENFYALQLEGALLAYKQETKWKVPCDGHPAGIEVTRKTLQRTGT
jgi:hypothetical protein